jgi:hypothetical protein
LIHIPVLFFVKRLAVAIEIHHCIDAMRKKYGENMEMNRGGKVRGVG